MTELTYAVNWDNGNSDCGTFPQRFDTEEAAREFADEWARERNLEDLGLDGAQVEELGGEGCYTAEVIECGPENGFTLSNDDELRVQAAVNAIAMAGINADDPRGVLEAISHELTKRLDKLEGR